MSDAAQCCQKPEVFEACPVKKAQDEKRGIATELQSGCLYYKEIGLQKNKIRGQSHRLITQYHRNSKTFICEKHV